jgi:hypothetical protein
MEEMGLSFQIIAYAELTSQTGNLIIQGIPQGQNTVYTSLVYFVLIEYRKLAQTWDPSHQRLSEWWPDYEEQLIMHNAHPTV